MLHLGHLVHNPSGMPRFLDLAPASFGFRAKDVPVLEDEGGVKAGSLESNPRVFFVKDVVAMIGAKFGLDGLV